MKSSCYGGKEGSPDSSSTYNSFGPDKMLQCSIIYAIDETKLNLHCNIRMLRHQTVLVFDLGPFSSSSRPSVGYNPHFTFIDIVCNAESGLN